MNFGYSNTHTQRPKHFANKMIQYRWDVAFLGNLIFRLVSSLPHARTYQWTCPICVQFGIVFGWFVLAIRYYCQFLMLLTCNAVAMAKMQIRCIEVWVKISRKLRHVLISLSLEHIFATFNGRERESVCVCGKNCKNFIKLQIYLSFRCDNNRQENFLFSGEPMREVAERRLLVNAIEGGDACKWALVC